MKLFGQGAKGHAHFLPGTAAPEDDVDPITYAEIGGEPGESIGIFDLPTVDFEDDVPGLDARLMSRPPWYEARHQRAPGVVSSELVSEPGGNLLDEDTHPASVDPTVDLEARKDFSDHIHGNRKTDALTVGDDRRVDTDDLAGEVYQRTAGITGIDRGVGLNEVLVTKLSSSRGQTSATHGTGDTGRDRRVEPERIADSDHPIAHP